MFKTVVIMLSILMIGVSVYAEDLQYLQPPTEFSPFRSRTIKTRMEANTSF